MPAIASIESALSSNRNGSTCYGATLIGCSTVPLPRVGVSMGVEGLYSTIARERYELNQTGLPKLLIGIGGNGSAGSKPKTRA